MIFKAFLLLATLLCSLVAGFLFAFAIVAMPGIGRLDDRSFLRAFQVMDGVIQDNQPIFLFVWVGSVIALVAAAAFGVKQLDGWERTILVAAAVVYLLGVQMPTARVNIPLNNRIQSHRLDEMNDPEIVTARDEFENRWNRSNIFRTAVAIVVTFSLLLVLMRL